MVNLGFSILITVNLINCFSKIYIQAHIYGSYIYTHTSTNFWLS